MPNIGPFELNQVHQGDCLEAMRQLPDGCVSAIVTDPPYGLSFMGKSWDTFDKSQFGTAGNEGENDLKIKKNFKTLPRYTTNGLYEFTLNWAKEALRVLKPGGYLLAFGGTRTYHRLVSAIEDAGFEIKDSLSWIHGQGFPKNHDVSKALDKAAGKLETQSQGANYAGGQYAPREKKFRSDYGYTYSPAAAAAKQWDGWGSALKPSWEPIVCARKPISEPNIAANVVKYGTGGINIDGCRVNRESEDVPGWHKSGAKGSDGFQKTQTFKIRDMSAAEIESRCGDKGRWPPNLLLQHLPECRKVGTKKAKGYAINRFTDGAKPFGDGAGHPYESEAQPEEVVDVWECAPGCPVAELGRQSGAKGLGRSSMGGGTHRKEDVSNIAFYQPQIGTSSTQYYDTGTAARFFPQFQYNPKAPGAEKAFYCLDCKEVYPVDDRDQHEGHSIKAVDGKRHCDICKVEIITEKDYETHKNCCIKQHPTVKAVSLMCWLVRLVAPPGGMILDLFAGTGSTCVAALTEGFDFIGVDQDKEYCAIANVRIEAAQNNCTVKQYKAGQRSLF